jgi:serine/threonine-protein kinase
LKVLLAGSFASSEELRRFRREATIVARLDHPNIVPVHSGGEVEGRPFLVMKWMEGGTLKDALPVLRQDLKAAVRLLVKVARAVQHAHERLILHRDLKAANVLLEDGPDGPVPFVADFGLARRLDEKASQGTVAAVGTPAYMAPEQVRGKGPLTTAVDVYGLGGILYEMLTGQTPFRGELVQDVLRQVEEQTPLSPASLVPGVDADLAAVCLKCLEKEPPRRYASAAALATELEGWLRGEGVSARPPGPFDFLRQEIRKTPPPFDYSWGVLAWMGLVVLATHGAVGAFVGLGWSAPWVWAALLSGLAGLWEVYRRFLVARFRELPATERHSLMIALGHLVANLPLLLIFGPLTPSAPARQVLALYPPLLVVSGLALFVTGSTHWGRLYFLGLAVMLFAPVLAWLPEWSPLLYGGALAVGLWWWAYCVWAHFPRPGEKAGG